MKIITQILFWLGVATFVAAMVVKIFHLPLFWDIFKITLIRTSWTLLLIAIAGRVVYQK